MSSRRGNPSSCAPRRMPGGMGSADPCSRAPFAASPVRARDTAGSSRTTSPDPTRRSRRTFPGRPCTRSRTTSRRGPFRRMFGRQRPPIPRGAWSGSSVRRGSRVASRQRSEARSRAQPRAGRRAGRCSRSVAKRGRTLPCRHPRRGRRSARAEDTARAVPWPGDGAGRPLAADEDVVRARLRRADARAGSSAGRRSRAAGTCSSRRRRARARRSRRSSRHRPAERDARRGAAPALRLAAQGAQLRHRAQPAQPARRARLEALGRACARATRRRGAAPDAADPAGHPHHDARVALPAAHLAGARDAARRSRR